MVIKKATKILGKIKNKSRQLTKIGIKRKIGIDKYENKKHRTNKKIEHYYFIVQCKYSNVDDLNSRYLETHLQNLKIKPDRYMNYIEMENKKLAMSKGIKYEDFCDFKKHIHLPTIKKNIIADVFFYHINTSILNKRFYKYDKYLLNTLDFNPINTINKDIIYSNIYKIDPKLADKYFIKTFPINQKEKYNFPSNYILRPIDSFGGQDILYINNKTGLNKAIEYYNKTKNNKNIIYGNDVTAAEFITNLLLFKGKKFHLRMYYMISLINNVFNSFLLDECKILTAKVKYNLAEPFVMEMHDTHFDRTDADYFIKDFTSENIGKEINSEIIDTIYKKCKELCSGISRILLDANNKQTFLYPNQKNGYYFFGLDILIRDDLEPILIECNIEPGMTCKTVKNMDYLSKVIYNWINSTVLEPLFKHNDPMIARQNPTYINI